MEQKTAKFNEGRRKALLQELDEIGEHIRHYDGMMARWSAIFLGLTVAIISLAVTYFHQLSIIALTGLAVFSEFSSLVTLLVVLRLTFFKDIAFQRAGEIEKDLDLEYYTRVQIKRKERGKNIGSKYTTSEVGAVTFLIFTILWTTLILIKIFN